MIKRIKGSLFAKVFILTVAVLLCVSFLVYGVLAWYMPQTYSNNLNAALDEQTSDFIYELEHIRMQDSGGLFDQFLQNTTISMVELYTADGVLVETPSNQNDFNNGSTGEALGGTSYESAPIISNSYYFSFADAISALESGVINLHDKIIVRDEKGERIETTVGRILFNETVKNSILSV